MSAVAMPFDPAFGMGPRSAFTWPAGPLESTHSNSMMPQDLHSMPSVSESSVSPERSLTSSPPRGFNLEQRDLKRQQDRARRENKLSQRMQRSDSNPYVGSPLLSDINSPMSMPVYSAAPAPLSMLSEPATSMPNQSYLSYSPPMPDSVQGGHVFPTGYPQSIHPSYSMSMEYPNAYAPSDYSTRSSSLSVGSENDLMYQMPAVMTSGGAAPEGGHVRVVQSRPKPRCWEHGCNGRQFSTFSNLLRHQREKSGQAAKASCPNCGAEFTRTTARNGHLLHDKCKQRRSS